MSEEKTQPITPPPPGSPPPPTTPAKLGRNPKTGKQITSPDGKVMLGILASNEYTTVIDGDGGQHFKKDAQLVLSQHTSTTHIHTRVGMLQQRKSAEFAPVGLHPHPGINHSHSIIFYQLF